MGTKKSRHKMIPFIQNTIDKIKLWLQNHSFLKGGEVEGQGQVEITEKEKEASIFFM
jgi:hypothetical protein